MALPELPTSAPARNFNQFEGPGGNDTATGTAIRA
jgi:hypothetical protein